MVSRAKDETFEQRHQLAHGTMLDKGSGGNLGPRTWASLFDEDGKVSDALPDKSETKTRFALFREFCAWTLVWPGLGPAAPANRRGCAIAVVGRKVAVCVAWEKMEVPETPRRRKKSRRSLKQRRSLAQATTTMSNRMRGVNPRTNLKAVVNTRRGLKGATTLPKAYLAAGVATMGAMTYLVLSRWEQRC